MDSFVYRDGELYCESVPVKQIAAEAGTPVYIYSAATLIDHYDKIAAAFAPLDPTICFAIKSLANLAVCRLLAERSAGFDVVSGGELFRALQAGGAPSKIVFAGVGKTDREIREAIKAGIGYFNVESEAEFENIERIASEIGGEANVALRVNPDVDPKTHRYTTTGKRETKFGVDIERAQRFFTEYGGSAHAKLRAIHLHIGSPVNQTGPYVEAITKALALIEWARSTGREVDALNVGGGFGAHYQGDEAPPAEAYADAIIPLLQGRGLKVLLEPGRSISCNAGILVSEVQYLKDGGDKKFVIVDAGMNDLLRPALYEAYHFIWPVAPGPDAMPQTRHADERCNGSEEVDIVGPICESSDSLGLKRFMPPTKRGDLLAIFSAGAYGFVMASQYNGQPRPPEILVRGDSYEIVRRRETYEDLVAAER
jgi:diaminopimelate decarboxylase